MGVVSNVLAIWLITVGKWLVIASCMFLKEETEWDKNKTGSIFLFSQPSSCFHSLLPMLLLSSSSLEGKKKATIKQWQLCRQALILSRQTGSALNQWFPTSVCALKMALVEGRTDASPSWCHHSTHACMRSSFSWCAIVDWQIIVCDLWVYCNLMVVLFSSWALTLVSWNGNGLTAGLWLDNARLAMTGFARHWWFSSEAHARISDYVTFKSSK